MITAAEYGAEDNEASRAARQRVLSYIKIGTDEQQRLIEYCTKNIPRDRYVPMDQKFMNFSADTWGSGDNNPLCINYNRDGKSEPIKVHQHAIGQLCDLFDMPRMYAGKLNVTSKDAWRRYLLAHNFNMLFSHQLFTNRKKQPAKFLHRLVGDELRAVLTQSYNRHLLSATMLQPFLAAITEVGAKPAKATITDMRVHLQCYLPYVFMPIPGEYVAMGVAWSNSDFGQGKLKISHTVMRLNGFGNLVTDDTFSRVHLSSVVEETDLQLDDLVAKKELEAVAAATMSAVREVLKPEQVKKVLDAITAAHNEKVPWHELKNHLAKFLSKKDLTTVETMMNERIQDLPPAGVDSAGNPLLSKWWASSVLAHLAEKSVDAGESMQLKQAAGTFLKPPGE
jgi:hypothetical protein